MTPVKFQVGDIVSSGYSNYEIVKIYGDRCDVKKDGCLYKDNTVDIFELVKKAKITNWQKVFENGN